MGRGSKRSQNKQTAAPRDVHPHHVSDPELWQQISQLFAKSLEVDGQERESFLRDLDSRRPDLCTYVKELLESYERNDEFLERPALDKIVQTIDLETRDRPAVGTTRKRSLAATFLYLFLFVSAIGLAYYIFAFVQIAKHGNLTVDPGWDDDVRPSGWRIVDVEGVAKNKLVPGDLLLALNGNDRIASSGGRIAMRQIAPGALYTLRVLRNGRTLEFKLVNAVRPYESIRGDIICVLIVSLVFYTAAILIGVLNPNGRVARFAYAALMAEALVLVRVVIGPYDGFLSGFSFGAYRSLLLIDGLHFAIGYQFYCLFFADLDGARRRSYMLPVLYGWGIVVGLINFAYLRSSGPEFDKQVVLFISYIARELDAAFYFVASLSICTLVATSYARVRKQEGRDRARWIALGSVIGILPYALLRLTRFVADHTGDWLGEEANRILFRLSILAAVSIPIATAYAIRKHHVFDIHVVIRRGLQYIMLKRVLQVVLVLPALALLMSLLRNSQRTVADALWHNWSAILLMILFSAVLRFRLRLRRWLDTQFFREAYDREQILLALIESVKRLPSPGQVARTVGEQVNSAFHPTCLFVLYAEERGDCLRAAYHSGATSETLRLSGKSVLITKMEAYEEGEYVSALRSSIADASEVDRLESAGVQLIIPMLATTGTVAGLLLLGPKMSDEAYTAEDRKLLAALAGQMAIVYENASLQRRLEDQRRLSFEAQERLEERQLPVFRECPECGRCFDAQFSVCDRDGRELAVSLRTGRMIAERYRLDRLIGKGAMGAVYEGYDVLLNRQVAIKIISGGRADTANWLKRVYREAKAAGRLNHPNIIATYDFGTSDAGFAYLVMEFIGGCTLRTALLGGAVAPHIAAVWIGQLLEGVDAAHRAGIVHRDLKPENVLIAKEDGGWRVKILDFGIAKTLAGDSDSTELTMPGAVLGSIQYMSPEQLSGDAVDSRSDIFAAGVMIFELITGRLPFSASSYTERIVSMLQKNETLPAVTPCELLLNEVLQKCLARSPADRYQSARELRLDVVPLIARYNGDAAARVTARAI